MHYSRKCRCIISILEINFVSEWIRSCQWNTFWASSLYSKGLGKVWLYFISPLNGRKRGGNWNGNWNVVSKLLTLECNFIGKWKIKQTNKQTRKKTKLESTFVWISTPANCLIYLGRAVRYYTPFMEHLLLEFIQQLLKFMGASDLQRLIFSHPQTSFQRMKRRHLHSTSRH